MRRTRRSGAWTAALAGLALAFPWGAAGQGAHDHVAIRYGDLDQMHEEALAGAFSSHAFAADLEEAAARHQKVAMLRPANDVRRFDCMAAQGYLLHAVGDLQGSQWFLESAARHAQATGEAFNAAMTYIDAAMVAREAEDLTHAIYLVARAKRLASSSLLQPAERNLVLARIKNAGA